MDMANRKIGLITEIFFSVIKPSLGYTKNFLTQGHNLFHSPRINIEYKQLI